MHNKTIPKIIYQNPTRKSFVRKPWRRSPRGDRCRGRGARLGASVSRSRQPALLARHARVITYYVPPRPPARLHGGRRSDLPPSTLLGTGGYYILTTHM